MIEISGEYMIATVDAPVSAFRFGAGFPLHALASMTGPGRAELDVMVAEATIDCYDEEEQLTGLATMIESNLEVPFTTTILGLVADCVRDWHEQAIHILDLPMPEPPPKGAEWIAACKHWAR